MQYTTAFGAPLDSPQRAGALLRAVASRVGLELAPVTEIDLAAATVSAHCWAISTGNTDLSGPFLPSEAAGIVPALMRAAGHGLIPESSYHVTAVFPLKNQVAAAIDPVVRWAEDLTGPSSLLRASYDLANTPDPQLLAIAAHLGALVETPHGTART